MPKNIPTPTTRESLIRHMKIQHQFGNTENHTDFEREKHHKYLHEFSDFYDNVETGHMDQVKHTHTAANITRPHEFEVAYESNHEACKRCGKPRNASIHEVEESHTAKKREVMKEAERKKVDRDAFHMIRNHGIDPADIREDTVAQHKELHDMGFRSNEHIDSWKERYENQ